MGTLFVELALNLGWLIISLAAFAFFGRHIAAKGDSRKILAACIALACMVCLLFPVISMTDDLNSTLALPEATKFKRLLASGQLAVQLFSLALIYAPARTWATLTQTHKQRPLSQAFLSFDLSRRPPPSFQFI